MFDFLAIFWIVASAVRQCQYLVWFIMMLLLMPGVAAAEESPFPDISFKIFSHFVKENFNSKITLSQVLLILFTITDNTDLLSLHARQQNPEYPEENRSSDSGWIKALARALQEKLGDGQKMLFKKNLENSESDQITSIGEKLDGLTKALKLYPYDKHGQFQGKLKPISHSSIQAAQVICPNTAVCETITCNPRSLLQTTKVRDVPRVTLIKGSMIYDNVQVLTGRCPKCKTSYLADRERVLEPNDKCTRVYLNFAKYLKVGQSLWVDRIFSNAVLNAMYSFHASAAAYTEFWNNTYWNHQQRNSKRISRHQIWQAFVQESLRSIAAVSDINLELQDGLAIDDVTRQAFSILGENGIIRAADQHACQECTQPFRRTAEIITGDDPAALVGIDENRNVPVLVGENAELAAEVAEQAREDALHADFSGDEEMAFNDSYVTMAVVDGIVISAPVYNLIFQLV
jgi:CxC5 like cysteine cluster associated with KDZ transposases